MNKFLILFATSLVFASCNQTTTEQPDEETAETQTIEGRYGDTTWNQEDVYSTEAFFFALGERDSLETTLTGTIKNVCQAKGCWMKLDIGGHLVTVKFKDYGYFVPMNSAGHEATVKGTFFVHKTSVAELQEMAKDENKTEEEIAAITQPEENYTFIAEGVVIK